jgi:hypothetical protein
MDFLTWFIALGDQLLYRQITTLGDAWRRNLKEHKFRITCIFFLFLFAIRIYMHIRK